MDDSAKLRKFRLYGEDSRKIAPEFLHIEPISARSRLYDWSISPHTHPGIHQLLLLERGEGLLVADGSEAPLVPGTLVAVPSHCVHGFRFDPGSEGWVFSFAIELLHNPRLKSAGRLATFDRPGPSLIESEAEDRNLARLHWLFADLSEDLGRPQSDEMPDRHVAQLGLILAVAEELLLTSVQPPVPGRKHLLALEFRSLVDQHYRKGWTVADYARQVGASEPTLTRACRAAFGKSPGALVQERLLLEAMRNLTYTSASVSQISGHLGFSDPAYFARFFKERTGMTATRFREQRAWLSSEADYQIG